MPSADAPMVEHKRAKLPRAIVEIETLKGVR